MEPESISPIAELPAPASALCRSLLSWNLSFCYFSGANYYLFHVSPPDTPLRLRREGGHFVAFSRKLQGGTCRRQSEAARTLRLKPAVIELFFPATNCRV